MTKMQSGPLAFAPLSFSPLAFGTSSGGEAGGIPEAPNDGKQYGRQNLHWAEIALCEDAGLTEAPLDGQLYGRKNGVWAEFPASSGGGDITGLYPEIVAGTTTPVTVGESAAALTLFTIPGSVIDAAVSSVLTIDILGYGALDAGYRELQLGYPSFSFGIAHVNGAKSIGVRFVVYVGEDNLYRLPAAVSPYMASTSATGIYARVAGRDMTIRVTPGETGTLTMNACIATKWRAPA